MFRFLMNLFKRKKKYKEPDYEIHTEEIGNGTMVRIEANRELTPEEIGKIITQQIDFSRIRKREEDE